MQCVLVDHVEFLFFVYWMNIMFLWKSKYFTWYGQQEKCVLRLCNTNIISLKTDNYQMYLVFCWKVGKVFNSFKSSNKVLLVDIKISHSRSSYFVFFYLSMKLCKNVHLNQLVKVMHYVWIFKHTATASRNIFHLCLEEYLSFDSQKYYFIAVYFFMVET